MSRRYKENICSGIFNRILQIIARVAPGAMTWRVRIHRWRGVNIGKNVWIGYDAIIETSRPYLVTIKDGASVGIRATIIAHMRESQGVTIEEDASVGAGALVLPGVTVGRGAVIAAGSVVTTSIPPMTLVRGNPAQPVAKITIPLKLNVSMREFSKGLKPFRAS